MGLDIGEKAEAMLPLAGDLVVLGSGGPFMLVKWTDGKDITCVYVCQRLHGNTTVEEFTLPYVCATLVAKAPKYDEAKSEWEIPNFLK